MMNRQNARGGAVSRQSSPLNEIMQARRSGMSPMQFLKRRAVNNPQAQEAMQALGGDQNAQKAYAQRLAKARGINLDDFIKQVGMG